VDHHSGGAGGQDGSPLAVSRRPPMRVPAGANQNRAVSQVQPLKIFLKKSGKKSGINRATISSGRVYNYPFEVSQTFERQPAQVDPAIEPVERRIDVGSGVGDYLDAADLKCRPLGVLAARR